MWPRLGGPEGLPAWTVMQAAATVIALLVLRRRALDAAGIAGLDSAWLVLPAAVLGSGGLAPYVAGDGAGASVQGATFAGVLALALYCRARRAPLGPLLDAWAAAGLAALPVAKLGCLLGGCCMGGASSPLPGVRVVGTAPPLDQLPAAPLHAVPLYEAGLTLAAAPWALGAGPIGQKAARVVLVYGVVRALTDPLRHDIARGWQWGGVSSAQVIAATSALVAAAWLYRRDRATNPTP
jgi:phosphatidylglycerol:prolipoprotein diacylglycerol transferase